MRYLLTLITVLTVLSVGAGRAQAIELLSNGDFESVVTSPPNWVLQEFATGSGTILNTAQQSIFGPQSGVLDLWLRAFAGGPTPGPDNLTNAILSQTVPVTVGETYTFSGYSRWETNYSGGVTTLDLGSPLGAVASPTSTTMELAFLDSGGSVIGTPVSIDLRTEQSNIDLWAQHTLMDTAPAGTAQARVTAEARDMVWNMEPFGSAFYDNFLLTGAGDPNAQLLANADLEEPPPTAPPSWTFTEDPNCCNGEILRSNVGQVFSNHTPGGATGVWLSAFFGANPIFEPVPVTGLMSQTALAQAGNTYTFSGWAKFEKNYSGGVDIIDPNGPGFFAGLASPTQTVIALEFLDPNGVVLNPVFDPNGNVIDPNSPFVIDMRAERQALCAGNGNDETCGPAGDGWTQHTQAVVAPAGTASARLTAGMIDGVFNIDPRQSAFFDDLSLTFIPEPTSAVLSVITLAFGILCRNFCRRSTE